MKPFFKRDVQSVFFILALILFGVTTAYLSMSGVTGKQKAGSILLLISTLFTTIGLGISIYRNPKKNDLSSE